MTKQLYTLLGISEKASAPDIKKSYRILAKKYHPDVNPGNKEYEKKFRDITRAYDILSDPEKREQYDRGKIDEQGNPIHINPFTQRQQGTQQNSPFQGNFDFNAEDIFESIFRSKAGGFHSYSFEDTGEGFSSYAPKQKGKDISYMVKISFLEACVGIKKKIVQKNGPALEVNIPAGVEDKQILRLKGKGEPSPYGGMAGDLLIEIVVASHPFWRREGKNILMTVPITLGEYAQGTILEVPTIGGPVRLKVMAFTKPGTILRLKGKGIPDQNPEKTGDTLVTINVNLPDAMTPELIDAINSFEKENPYNPRILFK